VIIRTKTSKDGKRLELTMRWEKDSRALPTFWRVLHAGWEDARKFKRNEASRKREVEKQKIDRMREIIILAICLILSRIFLDPAQ